MSSIFQLLSSFEPVYKKWAWLIFSVIILMGSYVTHFRGYDQPDKIFWDENYHIASAQKYLNGVVLMEPHPPLGKLLIALGEYLLHPNDDVNTRSFLRTDYIKRVPRGYSFAGVRLFPTLMACGSALLFFGILLRLSKRPFFSFLLSGLYLFENANILQSRSAMLEGPLLFFSFAALLYFIYVSQKSAPFSLCHYALLGGLVGLAIAVKVTAAILLLLFVWLFFKDQKDLSWQCLTKPSMRALASFLKALGARASVSILALGFVFLSVFYMHVSFGKRFEAGRSYKASDAYKEVVKEGAVSSLANFPVLLRDNLRFMGEYQDGVPALDVCKEGENGSYPLRWTLMGKTINYRWDKKDGRVRYLYLIGNPLIWWLALGGFLFGAAMITTHGILQIPIRNKTLFYHISLMVAMYAFYMLVLVSIPRVMYLYHYLVPLFFGVITFVLLLLYIFEESLRRKSKIFYLGLAILMLEVFAVYLYFSPFTYHEPMSVVDVMNRQWFDIWGLEYVQ